jgi:signal transduction histidine kinase
LCTANKIFAWFAWVLALWNLPYAFFLAATTAKSALVFSTIAAASATFISITFFHFIVSLLGEIKRYKTVIRIGYIIFTFFCILSLSFSPLFLGNPRPISVFDYWPKGGILFHPFIILWAGYFLAGYVLAILWYKKVDAVRKTQIKYILIGVTFGNFGGSLGWVLFYDIPVIPPIILISFMMFMIGYAALKYHLFNIKVITIELLTVTLWSFFLIKLLLGNQTGEALLSDLALFVLAIIVGIFMIRSGIKEANQKELLDDLNKNLEQKVVEQTKEIRRAYEVEKTARVELQKLDDAKDEFILASQHNLRTPLTITKGYMDEIELRNNTLNDSELKTYVDKTKSSLEILTQLISGLIDVTDLKVGKGGLVEKSANK